jgi:hypothetical protein
LRLVTAVLGLGQLLRKFTFSLARLQGKRAGLPYEKLQDSVGLDLAKIVGFVESKKWEVNN